MLLPSRTSGNFTRNCAPCYLIERDEGGQAAAQLMCSCGPEDSDIKTEYSLDLSKSIASLLYRCRLASYSLHYIAQTVSVTENGCLECMGAGGDCSVEVVLNPIKAIDTGDLDNDGFSNVDELIDWLMLRAKVGRTPCEHQILSHHRLLPETFLNTTYHRCKEDHGLCCFQTRGNGCNTAFEAFLLLEGNKYWYRMHYAINGMSLEIESLNKVFQLCGYPGQCKLESTPDYTPHATNCSYNPLEDYEDIVYDDGSDTLASGLEASSNTTVLPVFAAGKMSPRPTPAVNGSATFFWPKRKTDKHIKRGPSPSQRPLTGKDGK